MTELITTVQEKLNEISTEVDAILQKTNLKCPTNCGSCCHSPNVEAMPIEMLPLAMYASEHGVSATSSKCPFFKPAIGDQNKGRCTVYELRPSICRIFPYGHSNDKEGKVRWNPCSKMNDQQAITKMREIISAGEGITYSKAKQELQDIYPPLSTTMPINDALIVAKNHISAKQSFGIDQI